MKYILIIIILISGCSDGPYVRGRICEDLITQRASAIYNSKYEIIPAIDTMLIKCHCDSLIIQTK